MDMIVRVVRAAAVVTVLAMAGCSMADDGGRDYNPAHRPDYVLPGQDVVEPTPAATWPGSGTGLGLPGFGQAAPKEPDQTVRGGAGYRAEPHLFELADGSDVIRVSVADLGGDLFQVSTPGDAKVAPVVEVRRGQMKDQANRAGTSVVSRLRGTGKSGPALVTVLLAKDVRWQVRLSGGASDEAVDLTGAELGGDVELSAGTSNAEVALPAAAGTQKVTVGGGASLLLVRLAGTAPVRVSARDGAGKVTIDGQTQDGVPGGFVFAAPNWESVKDRFELDVSSGVSALTVARS
ncbi:hypothetical protein [Actinoplanes sp. NPDC051859]|uniref:hypothetical protein n=1 Tax=Actinoplanes sp. NPDC051859 TaxID=3363909 RepID=UPI0037B04F3F